jgi:hypothetical protein
LIRQRKRVQLCRGRSLLVDISERHRVYKPSLCAGSSQFAKLAAGLSAKSFSLKPCLLTGDAGLSLKQLRLCCTDLARLSGRH